MCVGLSASESPLNLLNETIVDTKVTTKEAYFDKVIKLFIKFLIECNQFYLKESLINKLPIDKKCKNIDSFNFVRYYYYYYFYQLLDDYIISYQFLYSFVANPFNFSILEF